MDRAAYDAIDRTSWTKLKPLDRSPLHYKHGLTNPREETDALRLGIAFHCLVLEPEKYATGYEVWTGRRQGKVWEAYEADAAANGRAVLKVEEDATLRAMAAAVHANPDAHALLTGGVAEHTVLWTDPTTGIECKGRLDYLTDAAVVDLKSCRDASPRGFGRAAASLLYHGQLAFYGDGVNLSELALGKATRLHERERYFVAVESAAPHAVCVYRMDDDAVQAGRETYQDLLRTLAGCRRVDQWPGYFSGVSDLALPKWIFGDDEALSELGLEA